MLEHGLCPERERTEVGAAACVGHRCRHAVRLIGARSGIDGVLRPPRRSDRALCVGLDAPVIKAADGWSGRRSTTPLEPPGDDGPRSPCRPHGLAPVRRQETPVLAGTSRPSQRGSRVHNAPSGPDPQMGVAALTFDRCVLRKLLDQIHALFWDHARRVPRPFQCCPSIRFEGPHGPRALAHSFPDTCKTNTNRSRVNLSTR